MHWKQVLIFIPCMLAYAAVGGVIFHFIESGYEARARDDVHGRVQTFLGAHRCLEKEDLAKLHMLLKKTKHAGVLVNPRTGTLENATNWDVLSSIFYASQIIGAVGYGEVTPRTVGGKVFTVLFVLVGIPLFVVFAFGIGKPIAKFVRHLERRFCAKWVLEQDLPPDHPKVLGKTNKQLKKLRKVWVYFLRVLILFVIGVVLFVLIPAAIFSTIEMWSYKDSVYYGFDTVLSIGFGEFVPGNGVDQSYRSWYRLTVSAYIYVGVAFFVVVFSPIHEALDFHKQVMKPLEFGDANDPFKRSAPNSVVNENFKFPSEEKNEKPQRTSKYGGLYNAGYNSEYDPYNGSNSRRKGLYPTLSDSVALAQGPVTSINFSN